MTSVKYVIDFLKATCAFCIFKHLIHLLLYAIRIWFLFIQTTDNNEHIKDNKYVSHII